MTLMNPLPPLGEEPFDDEALDEWMAHETFDVEALSKPDDYRPEYVAAARVEAWKVENDDQAEWAARKLAAAGLLIREKEALRNWWISQIEEWFVSETRQAQRTYAFFEGRLQDYALRERVEHGRATIKLPTAEFGTTARSAKVDVADDETLAGYLDARLARPPVDVSDEGLARWRAWWDAVEAAKESDESLVRRSAKVYVGPLRKLVNIEQRENGYEVVIRLGCEHEQTWYADTLEGEAPTIGEIIGCDACKDARPVVYIEFVPIIEHVVLGPDGEALPGVVVDPGGISPKAVVPRG